MPAVLIFAMRTSAPVLNMLLLMLLMMLILFGALVWFGNKGSISSVVHEWMQRNTFLCDVTVSRSQPQGERPGSPAARGPLAPAALHAGGSLLADRSAGAERNPAPPLSCRLGGV